MNQTMNQFQQNEQAKLPKMIEEPSASTIKFKFQFTNELFDKFENAYAGDDEKSIVNPASKSAAKRELSFERRRDFLLFEKAMAFNIYKKYPTISFEKA